MPRKYKNKYLMLKTTKLWYSGKPRRWKMDETGVPFYSGGSGYVFPKYLGEELVKRGLATRKKRR